MHQLNVHCLAHLERAAIAAPESRNTMLRQTKDMRDLAIAAGNTDWTATVDYCS